MEFIWVRLGGERTCMPMAMEATASIWRSIQGPTELAFSANWRRSISLFCCLRSSACSVPSRCGTSWRTSAHLDVMSFGGHRQTTTHQQKRATKKKKKKKKTTSVAAPNGRPAAQAVADQKTGAVPWATSSPLDGWVCWFVFGLVGWFWLVFGIGWFKRAASGLAISGPNKSIGAASVVANQSRVIDNDKNQTKKQTKKDQTHARTR